MRKRISPENRGGSITRVQIGRHRPFIIILLALSLCFFWGCDNTQKQDTKPPENKKIAVEATPTTPPSTAPVKELPVVKSDVVPASPENAAQTDSLDESEDVAEDRIYDPTGRIDPFAPLYRTDQDQKPPPDKGRILTPLEKLGINQLKLVAIVRSASGNTALVEDGTGKGYTIKTGIPIGLNSGIVTEITQSSVMIREETETITGEPVVQNIEMKLQKPAGE